MHNSVTQREFLLAFEVVVQVFCLCLYSLYTGVMNVENLGDSLHIYNISIILHLLLQQPRFNSYIK